METLKSGKMNRKRMLILCICLFIYCNIWPLSNLLHLVLFITRACTIINANLKLINEKYIHFIQSTFISVDTQQFSSKGIL